MKSVIASLILLLITSLSAFALLAYFIPRKFTSVTPPHKKIGLLTFKDFILIAVGLCGIAFQIPIISMIMNDNQTLFLGQWDFTAFSLFAAYIFFFIPIAFALLLLLFYKINSHSAKYLAITTFAFVISNQIIFNLNIESPSLLNSSTLFITLIYFIVFFLFYWGMPAILNIAKFSSILTLILIPAAYYNLYHIHQTEHSDEVQTKSYKQSETEITPVFFLTFEKLAISYMTDQDGLILKKDFPNLAKFLENATYYKNAFANSEATVHALASYYTGRLSTDVRNKSESITSFLGNNREIVIVSDVLKNFCNPYKHRCLSAVGIDYLTKFNLVHGFLRAYIRTSWPNSFSKYWEVHFNPWDHLWVLENKNGEGAIVVGKRQLSILKESVEQYGEQGFYLMHNFISDSPKITKHASQNRTEEETRKAFSEGRENLKEFDEELGNFINFLKVKKMYEKSLIFVGSDTAYEGLIFRNAHKFDSTVPYYDELMKIFMAIKSPHQKEPKTVDTPFQNIDVLPTMLDLLDIKYPSDVFEGMAITKNLEGMDKRPINFIFSEKKDMIYQYILGAKELIYIKK